MEESFNTLKFASRIKKIPSSDHHHYQQLDETVLLQKYKMEVESLKAKLMESNYMAHQIQSPSLSLSEKERQTYEEQLHEFRLNAINLRERISHLTKLILTSSSITNQPMLNWNQTAVLKPPLLDSSRKHSVMLFQGLLPLSSRKQSSSMPSLDRQSSWSQTSMNLIELKSRQLDSCLKFIGNLKGMTAEEQHRVLKEYESVDELVETEKSKSKNDNIEGKSIDWSNKMMVKQEEEIRRLKKMVEEGKEQAREGESRVNHHNIELHQQNRRVLELENQLKEAHVTIKILEETLANERETNKEMEVEASKMEAVMLDQAHVLDTISGQLIEANELVTSNTEDISEKDRLIKELEETIANLKLLVATQEPVRPIYKRGSLPRDVVQEIKNLALSPAGSKQVSGFVKYWENWFEQEEKAIDEQSF
jgi:hypothetical protein